MKKLITLLLTTLTITALASDYPKGSPKFKESSASVLSAAKKSGKPIVMVFSAVWCPPCQAMKKDVYPSAEIQALHDKFEWAYLDVDDSSNKKTGKKFEVSSIPHIQFLDSEGNALSKQVGGSSPAAFAKTLEAVLAKVKKS